jgi:spore germination cell wall hydrolase CwlJ-like protein
MKKLFAITLTIIICISLMASMPYSTQKDKAHEIAEIARQMGLPESDPIIVRAKELWHEADSTFQNDRDIIATVVYNEAWGGCSDRHRELVAAVVVNRVNDPRFPDTVYDVVTQPNQYLKAYADPNSTYRQRATSDPQVWAECQRIAARALYGEIECDTAVVWQAESTQGNGTYETHRTSYSTTYFCY